MNLLKKTETHWQWYRDLFQVTIFRYLITWFAFVPLVAKLLTNIPDQVIFQTAPNKLLEINISLPFHWELLWLSSLTFVIAFLLYKLFCPRFITTYPTYTDYKAYYHSPRWLVEESAKIINGKIELPKFFKRLNTKGYLKLLPYQEISKVETVVKTYVTEVLFNFEGKTYSLALPIVDENGKILERESSTAELEIFWEVYGRFSSSKTFIRGIILLSLIISLLLFGIVFIENIYNGLIYLLR